MSNPISNLISAIADIFKGIINFFLSIFQGAFRLVEGILSSIIELVYGVVNFLLSNLVPLAIVAGVIFLYFAVAQNQGSIKNKAKRATN